MAPGLQACRWPTAFLGSGKTVIVLESSRVNERQRVSPKLAWAGDQGLILGGLVDRMRYTSSAMEYAEMLGTAVQILGGVRDHLAVDGILQPWTPGQPPPAGDEGDYCTGVAVCMRYLLYAWQNNTDLHVELAKPAYQQFIRTNAERVIAQPSDCNTDEMANLINDLAVLVTAIGMGL